MADAPPPPLTIDDFDYTELTTSGRGNFKEFVREYAIAWEDLGGFLKALKGGWTQTGGVWSFQAPTQMNEPGFTNLYCVDADFGSYGQAWWDAGEGRSFWSQARVTAKFGLPTWGGADPATVAEEDLDFSVEQLTIPPMTMKADDTPIDQPLKVLIPLCAYTLTLYDRPSLPGGSALGILQLLGLVNSSTFQGAEVEKMLFLGAHTHRTVGTGGARRWTIEYKFLYRPMKWTEILINQGGTLTVVTPMDDDGNKLYTGGSFAGLQIPAVV